ncbi:MAG: hypothetical protein SCK28_01025 [Bacillota bacterium]|nr:hypothetical protein [Bacillota bacterium]
MSKEKHEKLSKGNAFVPENMGSATLVNLDGQMEPNNNRQDVALHAGETPSAPWGMEPSLEAMCEEAGVNFEKFLAYVKDNKSVPEMAEELGVKELTVSSLQDHFISHGIDSVAGISG